jgi:septal ring factor EnvC (AmiA/AmiB activator)
MNNYNFEFESLIDMIDDLRSEQNSLICKVNVLETEVERLKDENIETTNTLYEIINTLDKFNDSEYDLTKFTLDK